MTFHFVLIGWVFFRASNLSTALDVFAQIIFWHGLLRQRLARFLMVLAIAICAHFVPKQWYDGGLRFFAAAPYYAQAAAMALTGGRIQLWPEAAPRRLSTRNSDMLPKKTTLAILTFASLVCL